MKLKPLPKAILIFGVIGGLAYGGHYYVTNYAPAHQEAAVPMKGNLPSGPAVSTSASSAPQVVVRVPSVVPKASAIMPKTTAIGPSREIRFATIPWNATMGVMYSNMGAETQKGSLMDRAGIQLTLSRQDDYGQMQRDIISFAQSLKAGNSNPSDGVHFVVIMGNGAPNFLEGLNNQLVRFGSDYIAEIIAGVGYSRGEDKCMGTSDMITDRKVNPEKLKGSLIAEVKLDGDQDLCLSLAADNGVPVNVDESVYDPNAMNFVSTSTFVEAGQKYIGGYCEPRQVVSNGILTGETRSVCVNGVATWTPGDEEVVSNRGGLVTLASTRDYYWQMPATIIGIKKWNAANRTTVENMLTAIYAGGEAVQANDEALMRASFVSASVYKEKDAAYWSRYYRGAPVTDQNGLAVDIGGSFANGLADGMFLFGLTPGSNNLMEQVYVARGDVAKALYPDLLPKYPEASTVINTSYVQAIAARATKVAEPVVPAFAETYDRKEVVADKSWGVTFMTNKATFTPNALSVLYEIFKSTEMAGGLKIEVHGHTDNVGKHAYNVALSERRAEAVRDWLMSKSPAHFPARRFSVVAHGDSTPVASNDTEEGRSQNRRVEIILTR
jgi:outer membrane protein OmpA-like peptidoglycan-associated protein